MVKSKLLSGASHAFWEGMDCAKTVHKSLWVFLFLFTMIMARTAKAQITIDGNPADWHGKFTDPTIPFKSLIKDGFDAGDDIYTGGGSKDDNPISSWQWKIGSVQDKDDIENAGMLLIGHNLYFFADKYSVSGDANMGLWVFKNVVSKNPDGTFSGIHTDGDLFVAMSFVGGGGHPERHIYEWQAGALVEITLTTAAADVASNQSNVYPVPGLTPGPPDWTYQSKDSVANWYERASFLEGFVNLDSIPGIDLCFTNFIVNTRSSHSVGSTLSDLALGTFASRPIVTVADDTVCAGQPAVFIAHVIGGLPPITISWNGGTYAADTTFTINPATVNTVVTVRAQGTNGCISAPDTAHLVVKPSPSIVPHRDTTYCNGATGAAINFTSNPPGATFAWTGSANVGFGTSGTGNIGSFTATNTGTVAVTTTVTVTPTANGCPGVPDTFNVTVNPTPTVVAHGDSVYCNNANAPGITFSGTPAGVNFNWTSSTNIGFGTSNSGNIPPFVATNTGTVAVTATVVVTPSANGCTGKADTFLVTVNPTPNVAAHGDSTYCPNVLAGALNFSGTIGGTSFTWTSSANVGFGTVGTGNIPAYLTINGGSTPVIGTVVVTPSANGCAGIADTFTITVNPKPGPNAPVDNAVLCAGSLQDTIHLASLDPLVTTNWHISVDLGFGTNGSGNLPAFIGANPGAVAIVATVTVTSSSSAGCPSGDTSAFTITINPDAGSNAPVSNIALCSNAAGDSINIKGLDNVTIFTWVSTTNVGFGTSGTGNIPPFTAINNPGPAAITATVTVTGMSPSGCPGDTTAFTVTIYPHTIVTARDTSICAGSSVDLTLLSDPDGGTWTGTGVTGTTFNSVGLSAGAHGLLYTYTDGNGCTGSDSAYITILVNPTVVARDTAICAGVSFSLNLLSDPDGGTWSGTGVSGTTFNSVGLAPGTYGLLYTFSNGAGCSGSDSAYVTINANPVVTARDTAICSGVSFSLNLLSDPDGGTWSGTGVSGTTFNSVGLGAGVYGLLYTYTNGSGCTSSDSAYVTINALPVVTARDTSICSGNSIDLTSLSDPDGGTWTGTGVTGTTFNSVGLGAGVYGLLYTYTNNNGCTSSDSAYVTILVNPTVVARDTAICSGVSFSLNLLSDPDGGTWSGTGVSGTTFNSVGLAPGKYGLLYTFSNGVGCSGSDSAYITINANPVVTARDTSICSGVSFSLNLLSDPDGGTWSGTGVSGTIFNSAGLVAGKYGLLYTYTNGSGCTASDSAYVTINALPVVTARDTSICSGNSVDLTLLSDPDGGTWTGTGVTGTTFNSVGVGAGVYGLLYTYTNGYGCTNSDSAYITVLINPAVVARDTAICKGVSFSLNLLSDPDGGTWSGTGVSGTTFNSAGLTPGTYGLLYIFSSGAGCSGSDSAYVTVNPQPYVTARDTAICAGVSFSLNLLSDPDGGTWSGTGVSGTTFNSVGLAAGKYGLLYTYTNGSGCTASDSAYITIRNNPTVTARDTAICAGASVNLNLLSDPDGGTWTGTGVSGTTFNSIGLATGKYGLLYVYTNGYGCTGSDSAYITIIANPTVTARDTSICAGVVLDLNLLSDPDGGTWSGTGVSGTTFNSVGLPAGKYGLLYTLASGGCGGSDSAYITIKPTPDVYPHGDSVYCKGITAPGLSFTGSVPGTTFMWTSSANVGFGLSGSTNIGPYLTLNPGSTNLVTTVIVTPSKYGCVGAKDTFLITVKPKPTIPYIHNLTVCSGVPVGSINITGGDLVNTFTWTGTRNIGFGTSGTGNIGAFTAIVNYGPGDKVDMITVSVATTLGCPGDTRKFTITVQPKPHVVARDTTVCKGNTLNLIPLGTPAGGTWSGPGVSGTTFNSSSLSTGTYKIYYTVCNGACTAYDSAYICVTQCCVVYGTYTQGLYSACDYKACDGKGGKKTMVQLIESLLSCGGQITVGRPGRSVIVPTWAAGVLSSVLPSGYGANKLSYAGNVTISNTPGSTFAIKYLSGGKINNILMAQQIVLKLNLRLSPDLCNFPIQYTPGGDSYFQTFNAEGTCCVFTCGNTCPKCFCIKKSVAKYLTKGGTKVATVADLVNLADDLLGGWLIPGTNVGGYVVPSYADVADVIGTIHNAFDSYRTFNGSYGCTASKEPVASTIGDEIPNLEAQTRIYPNPTTGTFTIEVPAIEKDAVVVVLDINGRAVITRTLPANENGQRLQIDMPDVARGLYIIRIESDGKAFSKKLMLE